MSFFWNFITRRAKFDALMPLRLSVTKALEKSDLRAAKDGNTVIFISRTAQKAG
jgi:hypothetical protein